MSFRVRVKDAMKTGSFGELGICSPQRTVLRPREMTNRERILLND